jgi:hypothetical protein
MVLEAAVNSSAEAIVTFNKRDFLPEATQFNLQVLTPAEALWQLALRLLSSLKAKAEKLAALRTEHYFEERAKRADLGAFEDFLERAGDAPPRPGDETLPD